MVNSKIKPLQVLLEDFNLRSVIKEDFLSHLENEFENKVKVINLIIAVSDEDPEQERKNVIILSHLRPDHEKENKVIIDAPRSEDIEEIASVISRYG